MTFIFEAEQILFVGTCKVISGGVDFNRKRHKRLDNKEYIRNRVSRRVKGFASRDWHIRFLRQMIRGLGFAG